MVWASLGCFLENYRWAVMWLLLRSFCLASRKSRKVLDTRESPLFSPGGDLHTAQVLPLWKNNCMRGQHMFFPLSKPETRNIPGSTCLVGTHLCSDGMWLVGDFVSWMDTRSLVWVDTGQFTSALQDLHALTVFVSFLCSVVQTRLYDTCCFVLGQHYLLSAVFPNSGRWSASKNKLFTSCCATHLNLIRLNVVTISRNFELCCAGNRRWPREHSIYFCFVF